MSTPRQALGENSGPWSSLVYSDRLETPKVPGETREAVRAGVASAALTGEHLFLGKLLGDTGHQARSPLPPPPGGGSRQGLSGEAIGQPLVLGIERHHLDPRS